MTKKLFGAAIALMIIGAAPAAYANTKHTAHRNHNAVPAGGLKSFVDANNDGKYSTGDQPLPANPAPGVAVIDLRNTEGEGAVIGGPLAPSTFVFAPANIHVTANLSASKQLEIDSLNGDIWIDAGVHVDAGGYGMVLSAPNGTIHIGDNAQLNNGGGKDLNISARSVVVGNGVKMTAKAQDSGIFIKTTGASTFGTLDQFITDNSYDNSSNVSILTCGNVALDHATIKAEDITISGESNCAADGSVSVTNSTLELNTYSQAKVILDGASVDRTGTTITPAGVDIQS